MSVVMNFSIFPTNSKGESLSPFVAKVVNSIQKQGLECQLTSMGTIVETATLEQALKVIETVYSAIENESDRTYLTVSMDIRKGGTGRLHSKVKSVEDKLTPLS